MRKNDDINKIIHRIANAYSNKSELIDNSSVDEFYNGENVLSLAIEYNKEKEIVSETKLWFYSSHFELHKIREIEEGKGNICFTEVSWNDDKSVITTKLLDENKNEESRDICMFTNGKLIEQTMFNDGEEIVIKHSHDANGKIVSVEEFLNGQKTVITQYKKEGKGRSATRTNGAGKLLDYQYEEFDKEGRTKMLIDFDDENQKVCEAEFIYDKYGEKIMEASACSNNRNYIKRFAKYGTSEEMTFEENLYKYSDRKEWSRNKEFMKLEVIGKTVKQ